MSEVKASSKNTGYLADAMQSAPLPDWVRSMTDHYRTTGSYRPEDLRKVLGDPKSGVEVGSHKSLSAMIQALREE